jgi:hypothetical protein
MLAVSGVYENGTVRLDKRIKSTKKMKVIVTFLEDSTVNKNTKLTSDDFSFQTSREKTKRYKGSISDSIIEDRRIS